MSHRSFWEQPLPLTIRLLLAAALLLCAPMAVAQTNLGELLDTGATPLSAEEFRQEVVGRMIVGPTATGGSVELMYAANGTVVGTGKLKQEGFVSPPLSGEWKIDENGKVCTSMQIGGAPAWGAVVLPPRCQTWFKSAGQYFLSDSDSDRRAKVFRRTLKQ